MFCTFCESVCVQYNNNLYKWWGSTVISDVLCILDANNHKPSIYRTNWKWYQKSRKYLCTKILVVTVPSCWSTNRNTDGHSRRNCISDSVWYNQRYIVSVQAKQTFEIHELKFNITSTKSNIKKKWNCYSRFTSFLFKFIIILKKQGEMLGENRSCILPEMIVIERLCGRWNLQMWCDQA